VIAQRTLAILSAVLLVFAVAIAMLGPRAVTLARALTQIDGHLVQTLHTWIDRYLSTWIWSEMIMPLLQRPAWLLPAAAGIVCMGLSVSLSYRKRAHQSHRRS